MNKIKSNYQKPIYINKYYAKVYRENSESSESTIIEIPSKSTFNPSSAIDRGYNYYQFFDQVHLIEKGKTKIGKPKNISKLRSLHDFNKLRQNRRHKQTIND